MAYYSQVTLALDTNRRCGAQVVPGGQVQLSQILDASNIYFSGGLIPIRERWRITLQIVDPALISIDKEWGLNRYVAGNWMIVNEDFIPDVGENRSGFLTSVVNDIYADSYAVVTADETNLTTFGPIGKIQSCNFTLRETAIDYNGNSVVAFVPLEEEPLFQMFTQEAAPAVGDALFDRQLVGIRMYIKPGFEPVLAEYFIYPTSRLPIAGSAFTQFTCSTQGSCDAEFEAYILSINGGNPLDVGSPAFAFSTVGACNATWNQTGGGSCFPQVFNCSNGETRNYAIPNLA